MANVVCNQNGTCTIRGQGSYGSDEVVVSVQSADLKVNEKDVVESGFYQAVLGQALTISLVTDGSPCRIEGLSQLDSALPSTEINQYGSLSVQRTCKTPGEFLILGKNDVTQFTDGIWVRVSAILDTKWEEINSPLGQNTNLGGGERIFPDWVLADFSNPNGPNPPRSWVQVHSTVFPAPSDPNQPLTITFTPYDPDDPSTSVAPVDNETIPDDNRGGMGSWLLHGDPVIWNSVSIPVALSGHAATVFQVSPNPGDNFRAKAWLQGTPYYTCYAPDPDPAGVGSILRNDTHQPPPDWERTGLLTIWRKFHVECDTMAYPPDGYILMNCTFAGPPVYSGPLDEGSNTVDIINQLVPGILHAANYPYSGGPGTCFSILSNTAGDPFSITTDYPGPSEVFPLYDDDYNLEVCPPTQRAGVLPQSPGLSVAEGAYAKAYIVVQHGDVNWDSSVQPKLYLPEDESTRNFLTSNRQSVGKGRQLFWLGYVLSGFQFDPGTSLDPNSPPSAVPGTTLTTDPNGIPVYGSVVHGETLRDASGVFSNVPSKEQVVAHEITHQFHELTNYHAYLQASVTATNGNQQVKLNSQIVPELGLFIVADSAGETGSNVEIFIGEERQSMSPLASYQNLPDGCWITTARPLSPQPQAGNTARVLSKSLMSPKADPASQFCPQVLDKLRRNTSSPMD